jgi:colanic acid/amylovoran biosynthesis glycosyltransferase
MWHVGVTPDALRQVLELFTSVCSPISTKDVGPDVVRGRRLAVTFDDGFEDNFSIAAPILEDIGIPATFFLSSDLVGARLPWPEEAYERLARADSPTTQRLARELAPSRLAEMPLAAAHAVVHGLKSLPSDERDRVIADLPPLPQNVGAMMTWDDARALHARGFSIGSHGATHALLPGLPEEQLARELVGSRQVIEREIGGCDELAYPDNRVDEKVLRAAAAAGYRLGFTGGDAANGPGFRPLEVARLSGEDPRLVAVARRAIRRRQPGFSGQASVYAARRTSEYGFKTQAAIVENELRTGAGDVLDVGCGVGALTRTLERLGAGSITGIDLEPEMIDAAARRYPDHSWCVGDASALPFADGTFDSVVSLGLLEYVEDLDAIVRELARVARAGSLVLASAPQSGSPNAIAYAAYDSLRPGARDAGQPISARRLVRAFARAGLSVETVRSTNFFAFPFTAIAPDASRRVASALNALGTLPVLRRLGAQVVVAARKPSARVVWITPKVPPVSTFQIRELESLRALGVDVDAEAPAIVLSAAARSVRRHPLRALLTLCELQVLKAARDTERGRPGYAALWLKGLALAESTQGARLHAVFADGVGIVAYVAARINRSPYTFTAHSPYSLWQGSHLLALQARRAQFVACVSNDIAQRLADLEPAAHRMIVRCSAPSSRSPRADDTPPLFVAVGTLIPHKGFATAIRAMSLVTRQVEVARLVIVGDGSEREQLSQLAADTGGAVTLAGALQNEDVLELLRGARALVAPCEVQPDGDRDGLPVSILDAAAVGVPAITTPISGIPEFVRPGETGVLVPERDPEALAAAIVALATNDDEAKRLGAAARALTMKDYDARRETAKLLAAWQGSAIV